MTTPPANKRGAGWRARSEATARLLARTKRLDEAQVTRSDEELIAEAIAAGKVRGFRPARAACPSSSRTTARATAHDVLFALFGLLVRVYAAICAKLARTWSARSGSAVTLGSTLIL